MMLKWLALRDSNPRLADYEPAVLTAELRAGEFRGHEGRRDKDTVQRCKAERSSCAKVQKWDTRVWSLEYRV